MRKTITFVTLAAAGAASLTAQTNVVNGLDGRLTVISEAHYFGRRGPAYPNGEVGVSFTNEMCNPGTVVIPWDDANGGPQPMGTNHPKFGFMVTRTSGDRMVQISDRSFCKHAFTSVNVTGPNCGGSCVNPGTGAVMGLHCFDTYSWSNNGSRTWLGPADEINPWTGVWDRVHSYFDRGDPEVAPPQNTDGVRSLNPSGFDVVKNRVTIKEQDLAVPSSLFHYSIQLVHEGESVLNRADNLKYRRMGITWTGSTWSSGDIGSDAYGSILNAWSGATVNGARNGMDDGTFYVAVKVTGPVQGKWHYEYAVHNVDNSRGGGALRIPLCSSAVVSNVGFRDIDSDPNNQWTVSVQNNELMFAAPATNPQNWNTLFNFWFDSDAAPVAGQVNIDEARVGPGNLSVAVNSQVPGFVPNVHLGAGCGTTPPLLYANGIPSIPNPAFQVNLQAAPGAPVMVFFSFNSATLPIGVGCTQYLDTATLGELGTFTTNAAGLLTIAAPIPSGLAAFDVCVQAAELSPGGPVFGNYELSNGLKIRVGGTGCP